MSSLFGSFLHRRKGAARPVRLLLTPMMDMFTIILVFLLVSFAPDDPITAQDVELARSTHENTLKDAIRVTITPEELQVQDVFLAPVRDGAVHGVEVAGQRIVPLYDVLRRLKGERLALLEQRGEDASQEDAVLVLLVDHRTPYALLRQVTATAAAAGYPNARFGVMKGATPLTLPAAAGAALGGGPAPTGATGGSR